MISKDIPFEAFALADYIAVPVADGALHEEIVGDPVAIPDDVDCLTLIAHRDNWPQDDKTRVVKCRVELSLDGGAKWQLLLGFPASGGVTKYPDGSIDDQSWMRINGIPRGTGRQVRTTLIPFLDLSTKLEVLVENRGIKYTDASEPHSSAYDANSHASFSNLPAISWTHTPTGTPTSVGIDIGNLYLTGAATNTITSVTYGGTATTQAITKDSGSAVHMRSSIFGLGSGIPTGAQLVVVTFDYANQYGEAGAVTVTGSDGTTVFSNTASAGGNSTTAWTVDCTSATDEVVLDCVAEFGGTSLTMTSHSGRSSRYNQGAGSYLIGSSTTEPGASTVTCDWVGGASTANWSICAASFKAAAAAATDVIPLYSQIGAPGVNGMYGLRI